MGLRTASVSRRNPVVPGRPLPPISSKNLCGQHDKRHIGLQPTERGIVT